MDWQEFIREQMAAGAHGRDEGGRPRIATFVDAEAEYRALGEGLAVVDRSERGLLEIRGGDRVAWLQNLTTNDVKPLSPGEGCYSFFVNVKGRILFDANVCTRADSIWVDLDRRILENAKAHFDKYVITEDVSITDRSEDFVRLALAGKRAKDVLRELGAGHAAAMEWLATTDLRWNDTTMTAMRHDFCGTFAVEMFVPARMGVNMWRALTDPSGRWQATPVGEDAVQMRRIEAGIPWPFREITEEYLPAETGQFRRAVSYTKGCYLGQEVVERMRSRDVVARQLVGIKLEGDRVPATPAAVHDEESRPVGTMTSACHSPALATAIGLVYVKMAWAAPGRFVRVSCDPEPIHGTVSELPFARSEVH